MRQQAMSSRMLYARPIPINRVVNSIADRAQANTQYYGRRPYGVGFLIVGHDESGPHLFEFTPSGNCQEYYAMSIGARSQSAKTYLERHFEEFADCDLEGLIRHGLHALRDTLQQDKELTIQNTSIGIVGPPTDISEPAALLSPPKATDASVPIFQSEHTPKVDLKTVTIRKLVPQAARQNFRIVEGDALRPYLEKMEPKEGDPSPRSATTTAPADAPMADPPTSATTESDRMETDE